MTREQLLSEIDAFLRRHGMTDYALGKVAANDGHLIRRMRDKKMDPRLSTIEKIVSAMHSLDKEAVHGDH